MNRFERARLKSLANGNAALANLIKRALDEIDELKKKSRGHCGHCRKKIPSHNPTTIRIRTIGAPNPFCSQDCASAWSTQKTEDP